MFEISPRRKRQRENGENTVERRKRRKIGGGGGRRHDNVMKYASRSFSAATAVCVTSINRVHYLGRRRRRRSSYSTSSPGKGRGEGKKKNPALETTPTRAVMNDSPRAIRTTIVPRSRGYLYLTYELSRSTEL